MRNAFYGDDLAAIHAAGFTDIARAAAEQAQVMLAPGSRVLEVGCGDGTTAGALGGAGHEVIGVDRSPAMVAIARRKHPSLEFEVGDDATLPGDLDDALDAVLAIGEVLAYVGEHDPEPLTNRLARLLRLLRPDGLLLFDLPTPSRIDDHRQHTWGIGPGWAVLVAAKAAGSRLTRTIITFRATPAGDYRRTDELHDLELHSTEAVIDALHAAGARDPTALPAYAGLQLPTGLCAYSARRREPSPG